MKNFVLYKPVKPTSITAFVDTSLIAKNLIADDKEVFFLNFQVENKEKPEWFEVYSNDKITEKPRSDAPEKVDCVIVPAWLVATDKRRLGGGNHSWKKYVDSLSPKPLTVAIHSYAKLRRKIVSKISFFNKILYVFRRASNSRTFRPIQRAPNSRPCDFRR